MSLKTKKWLAAFKESVTNLIHGQQSKKSLEFIVKYVVYTNSIPEIGKSICGSAVGVGCEPPGDVSSPGIVISVEETEKSNEFLVQTISETGNKSGDAVYGLAIVE